MKKPSARQSLRAAKPRRPTDAAAATQPAPAPSGNPTNPQPRSLLAFGLVAALGTLALASRAAPPSPSRDPLGPAGPTHAAPFLWRSRFLVPATSLPLPIIPTPSTPHPITPTTPVGPAAVSPAQSQVLQRLAALQAQALLHHAAAHPAPASGPPPSAAPAPATLLLPLTRRDVVALAALASPAAKLAYLEGHLSDLEPFRPLSPEPVPSLLQDFEAQYQQWTARAALSDRLTTATQHYLRLLQTQAQAQARQQSLAEAQRILARQQVLVATGRHDPATLPLLEEAMTRAELLQQAAGNLVASEAQQLLVFLELGTLLPGAQILANEDLAPAIARPVAPQLDFEALWSLAEQYHPDYRRQLLLQARNLAPRSGLLPLASDDRPNHDPQAPLRSPLQMAIHTAIQAAQARAAQLTPAHQALQAAEAHLRTSEQAQAVGRGNARELYQAQQQLADQRQAAIQAQVAYLEALTNLDQAVGATLIRWGLLAQQDSDPQP